MPVVDRISAVLRLFHTICASENKAKRFEFHRAIVFIAAELLDGARGAGKNAGTGARRPQRTTQRRAAARRRDGRNERRRCRVAEAVRGSSWNRRDGGCDR